MSYNMAWLDYTRQDDLKKPQAIKSTTIYQSMAGTDVLQNALSELKTAFVQMYQMEFTTKTCEDKNEIMEQAGLRLIFTTKQEIEGILSLDHTDLSIDGFYLDMNETQITLAACGEVGMLYGVFELIRNLCAGKSVKKMLKNPEMNLRMLNHWDNLDGSIERGYSGKSFFFETNVLLVNERIKDYARLIGSIGINASVINNVNVRGKAASNLITDEYLGELKKVADIFAGYGIKLYLSINFAAPMEFGGLSTADPLDKGVIEWWEKCVAHIYEVIPNFGGFLVKADSEFRPGPFTYNRSHADGANLLGRALKPFGGLLIWRCFVYNCKQDWRDKKTDRARAAYDNFIGLDGQFDENVILQIKNGPMDFQVREPVSPLFGGLKHTNMILEVQAAQEYTGQQKDICYLIPMWKEVLNFHTYAKKETDTVADIVSGRTYHQFNCGMAAVSNTGNDDNWTGNDLAAANLYGYGRLCFDSQLTAEEIANEWICLTFGTNQTVCDTISKILLGSWSTYEKYTSPLGIGWMVNPNYHYGPNVDGYEYQAWGTYHRADHEKIGVDRTTKGTGYTMQYNEPNASMYENVETCPEELLLFFHTIYYNHKLKSGKTLLQHIYDTHFEGVEEVTRMMEEWDKLETLIAPDRFHRVQERMQMQLQNAKEWRDIVNTYFYRKTGIQDEKGREIYS